MLDSLPLAQIVLIGGIYLLGGFVKGVVGFGLPTIALGLAALTMPIPAAMALVLAPTIATNVWQGLAGGHLRQTVARLRVFLLASGLGTLAATGLLARADAALLSAILGGLLVVSSLSALLGPKWPTPSAAEERWLGPLMGLLSGACAGLTGSYMMPAAPWLSALRLPPDIFVQGFGLGAVLVTMVLTAGMAGHGMLTAGLGLGSLAVLAPAFAGMALGRRLRGRLPDLWFRRAVQVVLLAVGVQLVAKALL